MKTDDQLQQDVIDELIWEPRVDATHVGVRVEDGVVLLTGYVPSYPKKRAAEEAALRVRGVRAVADEMEVRLPGGLRRADAAVARAAADALAWDVHVPDEALHVEVEAGVVTLTGEVPWDYQRRRAVAAVGRLAGVRRVVNLISVRPQVAPAGVEGKIERAFARTAHEAGGGLRVEADGGEVVLRGTVASPAERRAAARAAWSAPGVTRVRDELEVQPLPPA